MLSVTIFLSSTQIAEVNRTMTVPVPVPAL